MSDDQVREIAAKVGEGAIEFYARLCLRVPKSIVVTGMTGALAAVATEAGLSRDNVIAALNSAFDDIENGGS